MAMPVLPAAILPLPPGVGHTLRNMVQVLAFCEVLVCTKIKQRGFFFSCIAGNIKESAL